MELNGDTASFSFFEDGFNIDFGETDTELKFCCTATEDTEIIEIAENSILFKHNGFLYGFKTTGRISETEDGYIISSDGKKIRTEFFKGGERYMNFQKKISKKVQAYGSEKPLTVAFLGDSVTHGCFELNPTPDDIVVFTIMKPYIIRYSKRNFILLFRNADISYKCRYFRWKCDYGS